MRITAECGCGANIVADSSGSDELWVLDRVMKAVAEFKEARRLRRGASMTTRAVLKKLVDAVQNFAEERMLNGDDDHAMNRAGLRVDRALIEAHRHLAASAPKRRGAASPSGERSRG
jgi:hypothetical protein